MNKIQQVSLKAYIRDAEGRVLMVKDTKGVWEMPGGRLEFGESPVDGLRRELTEELGVGEESVRIGEPFFTGTFMANDTERERQIVLIFFKCDILIPDLKITLDHESTEYKWIVPAEVDNYPMRDVYKQVISSQS